MNKTKILIVEDEAIVAENLTRKLEGLGYEVVGSAIDSLEAIDMTLRFKPQLILMDIQLGGEADGIDAAQMVRMSYDVPVIYLTAHSDPNTLARAKITGPFGYIIKPFEMRDLATQIELALYKHKTERELREREERLRIFIEHAPASLAMFDRQMRYVSVSRRWMKDYRLGDRDLIGLPHYEVFPGISDDWKRAHQRGLAGEVVQCKEDRFERADGTVQWLQWEVRPWRDAADRVAGIVIFTEDITDRKNAEEALRQSELFHRQMLESIPGMTFTTRADGYCDYQSRQWVEYTGIPMSEHLGNGWNQLLHPDDQPRALNAWNSAVAGLAPYDLEYRVRRKDGEFEWFKVIGQPILDENSSIVRWFGVGLNIESLKKAEAAIREREEWWSVTLSSIGDAVIATDTQGKITFLNPVAENLTGWLLAEAFGKAVSHVFHIVNEESRQVVENPVARVLKTGAIVGLANHTLLIKKDGGEIPIDDSGAPIRDAEGRILGAVLVFRDISERRIVEKKLQTLNESLERQVAERTRQAETRARQLQSLAVELIEAEENERKRVAHLLHDDLQQVLASARMQLESVCANISNEPVLPTVVGLLAEAIKKSRHLSQELSPPILYHTGLTPSLHWLANQMKMKFGLTVHVEENGGERFENEFLKHFLFRAVQELLFNVVKHSGVDSARVALSIEDNCLNINVSDNGKGFDPARLETISASAGFGLLSLRERSHHLGGDLKIESADGLGSCLTLKVPLTMTKSFDGLVSSNGGSSPGKGRFVCDLVSEGIGVLLVDDHRVIRQGLAQMINGQPDIKVVGEAANGLEAIDQVRALRPDVVIMDINMPKMGGLEATRSIKTLWPDVEIIGLSMLEDDEMSHRMREAGAKEYLNKNISMAELLKVIYKTAGKETIRD
jgi:PAS domain S-box-containing protein